MKLINLYIRVVDAINVGFWYWAGWLIGGCPIDILAVQEWLAYKWVNR